MTDPILIYPDMDCFVRNWPYYTPYITTYTASYGPLPWSPTDEHHSYSRFYIPPELTADDILSAILTVTAFGWDIWEDVPNTHTIHKISQYWDYSTLTWNNQPTHAATAAASLYHPSDGEIITDVTQLVKDWITGPNYGMVIMPPAQRNNYLKIYSSRGSPPPVITITTPPFITAEFEPLERIKIGPL